MRHGQIYLLLFTLILGTQHNADLLERYDFEGELLSELAIASLEGRLAASQRIASVQHIARNNEYPYEVISAFADLMFPDENSISSLDTCLARLVETCLVSIEDNSGTCFAILGLVVSILPGILSTPQLHTIQVAFNSVPGDVVDVLFALSMDQGSTIGTLASYQRSSSKNGLSNELICEKYADSLVKIARDSSSTDVLSDFLAPGPVNFQDHNPPRSFIAADLLDGSGSEGVDYFIRVMKDNAASFSSAMLFGGVGIVEMFDIGDDLDMDEVIESAENFAHLDDQQVAQELIDVINSMRYTTNALRFNKALELVNVKTSCLTGMDLLAKISTSQSLLVKILFFSMKIAFFRFRDRNRALFFGLVLVALGEPNSARYVRDIFSSSLPRPNIGGKKTVMRFLYEDKTCEDHPLSEQSLMEVDCLDACIENNDCRFSIFQREGTICRQYRDCAITGIDRMSSRVYRREYFFPEVDCFVETSDTICIEQMHIQSARIHLEPQSIYWLMYFYTNERRFDEALMWARKADNLGLPEGTYHLARLISIRWAGHEPEWDFSFKLLSNLVCHPKLIDSVADAALSDIDDFQLSEFETVQEIAEKIGIFDATVAIQPANIGSPLIQRIAGLVGIAILYARRCSYVLLTTIIALFIGVVLVAIKRP